MENQTYSVQDIAAFKRACESGVQLINKIVERGTFDYNEKEDFMPRYDCELQVTSLRATKEILAAEGEDISSLEDAIAKGETFLKG
jgi:hypothetical protein